MGNQDVDLLEHLAQGPPDERRTRSPCRRLERDETSVGMCCGGGGYGRPVDRDPARVARDSQRGLRDARAEIVSGVALDAPGAVDAAARERRRSGLR